MDLTINIEDYKLNIRTTGVLIHNGKVLLHKDLKAKHYALIGGRVKIGESSEEAVKREIKEELGKEIEVLEYLTTIENFFDIKNVKYQEIMFVYKIEFKNEKDREIDYLLKNIEGENYIEYEWIDLNEIEECKLLPAVLKEMLKTNKFPSHKINNDLI